MRETTRAVLAFLVLVLGLGSRHASAPPSPTAEAKKRIDLTKASGESMRFEQTAEIVDYDGEPEPKSHVAFLKTLPNPVESKPLLR